MRALNAASADTARSGLRVRFPPEQLPPRGMSAKGQKRIPHCNMPGDAETKRPPTAAVSPDCTGRDLLGARACARFLRRVR